MQMTIKKLEVKNCCVRWKQFIAVRLLYTKEKPVLNFSLPLAWFTTLENKASAMSCERLSFISENFKAILGELSLDIHDV